MYAVISFVLAVVSLTLGFAALDQFRSNKREYQIVWAAALFLTTVASVLWFLLEVLPIDGGVFRWWFFTGAMAVPVAFAAGMLFLVATKQVAWGGVVASGALLLVGLIATMLMGLETPASCATSHPGLTGLNCLSSADPITGFGYFPMPVTVIAVILFVYSFVVLLAGSVIAGAAVVLKRNRLPAGGVPDGLTPLATGADLSELFTTGKIVGVVQLFFANWDFWKRDRATRRSVGASFLALGAKISAIGLILGALGLAGVHLWLVFIAALVMFVGLMAIQDVFEVDPVAALRP